jgi:hypothetical protein
MKNRAGLQGRPVSYLHENLADLVAQGQFAVNISSFGEAESGEIYLTDLGGSVYRVVVKP